MTYDEWLAKSIELLPVFVAFRDSAASLSLANAEAGNVEFADAFGFVAMNAHFDICSIESLRRVRDS